MIFANPKAWYLLWFLPLAALALHVFYLHRLNMMNRFAQEQLHPFIAKGLTKRQYQYKAACLLLAFLLMIVALTRPQWGYHQRQVKRHGLDIMVVIDVSKSMLTADVSPSRLERTKLAVKDLVTKLKGSDHIGLIAFAGDAMLMCPMTYDYNGFLLSLDDLSINSIPRGGTDIAKAISEAVKAYQGLTDADKAVVLVTDGEELEESAIDAAKRAHEKGVKIFTVGVGTREGELIQVANANGTLEFLKDAQGNAVKSRLDENLLQQIAYVTGGAYVRSGAGEFGLDYLYDKQLSLLKKHDAEEKMARIYEERYQWPLFLALLVLLLESILFNYRWGAFFDFKQKKSAFIFLCVMLGTLPVAYASTAGEVNHANVLYKKGNYDQALKLYDDALSKNKTSSTIKYDLATAYYKKGDYDKAYTYLNQALLAQDKHLKSKITYNLGNVLYKSALRKENTNVGDAIKLMNSALGYYDQALSEDPKDADARFNQEFVKKEIERLKKMKQPPSKGEGQNQDKKQQSDQKKENKDKAPSKEEKGSTQEKKADQKNQNDKKSAPRPLQDKKQADKKDKAQKTLPSLKDLDRKQAEDLLEEYQENEEPKKLLNYNVKKIDERVVLKDW